MDCLLPFLSNMCAGLACGTCSAPTPTSVYDFISSDPAGLAESLPWEPAGSRAQRSAESQPRQILGTTRRLGGTVIMEAEVRHSCVCLASVASQPFPGLHCTWRRGRLSCL